MYVCVRETESQRERESLVGTTRYRVQGKGVRGVRGARGVANVLLMWVQGKGVIEGVRGAGGASTPSLC